MHGDFSQDLPVTITANIYEANDILRGTLLASGQLTAVQGGIGTLQFIPINLQFEACKEYNISVDLGTASLVSFDYWDEQFLQMPFDAGGVIRVRTAEQDGNPTGPFLPRFSLIGIADHSPLPADLRPDNNPPIVLANPDVEQGIYVTAEETFHINSLGWHADLPPGDTISAAIYEAVGTTRGDAIGTGFKIVTSSGLAWHDIPVNAVLAEGADYDLAVTVGALNSYRAWDDFVVPLPYTSGGIRVRDAETSGNPGGGALIELRIAGGPYVAGFPTDLRKVGDGFPPPFSVSEDNAQYGAYVESLIDQEVYSLGWMADIPEGTSVVATVYSAIGTTRDKKISEGTIKSSGSGMRWHDVPLAASLDAGGDYDLAVSFGDVTEWHHWTDVGLPYNVLGQFSIVDGNKLGDASNTTLIHMRANVCNVTATAIGDGPLTPPEFVLGAPYPNPVRNGATVPFSVDADGRVAMALYNARGQRVAEVMNETRPLGRGTAHLDASSLASGVYFLKMSAGTKTVTRKITIVR